MAFGVIDLWIVAKLFLAGIIIGLIVGFWLGRKVFKPKNKEQDHE